MFSNLYPWIVNGVLVLVMLSGLFLAAHGGSDESYYFGLTLSAIALAIMVGSIRKAIDRAEQGGR